MTTIESITIHRRALPLRRPFVTAVRSTTFVDALLLEVRDSDGRSGWGEAPTSWRVTGESVESVTAAVVGPLSAALLGRSTDDPAALSAALSSAVVLNASARMGLDCACYDLAARLRDVPLYRFLGGAVGEVRTDMTLSAATREEEIAPLCDLATTFVSEGFHTLKVKVGASGDDVRTLIDVRRAVGSHVHLRIDANQGWSPQEAIRIIAALEDAGVGLELVEQPVARDDVEGLASVTRSVMTPIMADESVWTRRDLHEIVRRHAVDMINVKLAKTGGLTEAIALIELAKAHGVASVVGCMAETHVGVSAAAALAAASYGDAPASAQDLDGGLLFVESPVAGGIAYDGDRLVLDDASGTGIVGLTS